MTFIGALMLPFLFKTAAGAVSLFTTICIVRIIITWVPQINYSAFGRFLSALCDPYLNLFGRIPLRIGAFDFTPMLAIGVLSVVSSVLAHTAQTGRLYLGGIVANILMMLWSIASSVAGFLLIVLIIRLVVLLFFERGRPNYGSIWYNLDAMLNPAVMRIASFFSGGKLISYMSSLLISIGALAALMIGGRLAIGLIIGLVVQIPI